MHQSRPFLIVGHPGHELEVHRWLETARPRVFVLTDGSGARGPSRIAASRACLEAAGAETGAVFGQLDDRAWYRALMSGDAGPLLARGRAILAEAVQSRPALIVSDGAEGYNPMHDLAFALAEAVSGALADRGLACERWSFPVAGPIRDDQPVFELELDAAAVDRKLAAASAYPGLEGEIAARLAEPGYNIAREQFFAPEPAPPPGWQPFYEQVGRERVAQGRYAAAIEYARHVRPAIEALRHGLVEAAPAVG
jgi:hypothetical protein